MDGNKVVSFAIGCRRCVYLERIGKNTYACVKRVHMDDSEIIPIKNGMKTKDFGICDGQSYHRAMRSGRLKN